MAFDPKTYVSNRVYSGRRTLSDARVQKLRDGYERFLDVKYAPKDWPTFERDSDRSEPTAAR